MSHPVATLFALTMVVWVADVRFAPPKPAPAPLAAPVAAACADGPTVSAPGDADVELVVCGSRLK